MAFPIRVVPAVAPPLPDAIGLLDETIEPLHVPALPTLARLQPAKMAIFQMFAEVCAPPTSLLTYHINVFPVAKVYTGCKAWRCLLAASDIVQNTHTHTQTHTQRKRERERERENYIAYVMPELNLQKLGYCPGALSATHCAFHVLRGCSSVRRTPMRA
jgi:hypothetical protein